MSNATAFALSPSNSLGSNTPVIVATVLTLANTEYSYSFPAGTGTFFMQWRAGGAITWGYVSGAPASMDSLKISPGGFYAREDIINTASYTLFFQSTVAGTIIAVETWRT